MSIEIETICNQKKEIVESWVFAPEISEILLTHNINPKFFSDHFAQHIFDFFAKILKNEAEKGTCPVMEQMLLVFRRRKIPLQDVFLLCSGFKNQILKTSSFSLKQSLEFYELLAQILDTNFKGIIEEYIFITFNSCSIYNKQKCQLTQNPNLKPRRITNAIKFKNDNLHNITLESNSVLKLQEFINDFKDYLQSWRFVGLSKPFLELTTITLESISKILSSNPEFKDIYEPCDKIAKTINFLTNHIELIDSQNDREVISFTLSFLDNIEIWFNNNFTTSNNYSIPLPKNYFDSAVYEFNTILNKSPLLPSLPISTAV